MNGDIPHVPPIHWGTFSKNWPLAETLSHAWSVVDAAAGMNVTNQPSTSSPVVIGQSSGAIVFVFCAAIDNNTTWVMVEAASSVSSVAETYRNSIREDIVKAVKID